VWRSRTRFAIAASPIAPSGKRVGLSPESTRFVDSQMTYYPDQSSCGYFECNQPEKLIAVGWLDPGDPFNQGPVSADFFSKLTGLLVNPWQPAIPMGRHECGFCRFSGGPGVFRYDGLEVHVGISNVFVPAGGFLYVAPSLILHYIDSHGYSPPDDFQRAVLGCPPMRSIEYLKAVLTNGPKGLAK
jgi:hypothetical protein